MNPQPNAPSDLSALGEPVVEQLTPYLQASWFLDRQIMVLLITGITRAGTDVFAETGIGYFSQQYEAKRPVLYLMEVRADLTLTPYFRQRAESLIGMFKGIEGRAAYIFDGNVLLRIAKTLIMILQRRLWPRVQAQTFKERDAALVWLYDGWREDNRPDETTTTDE